MDFIIQTCIDGGLFKCRVSHKSFGFFSCRLDPRRLVQTPHHLEVTLLLDLNYVFYNS